jgi:hypothetical protein
MESWCSFIWTCRYGRVMSLLHALKWGVLWPGLHKLKWRVSWVHWYWGQRWDRRETRMRSIGKRVRTVVGRKLCWVRWTEHPASITINRNSLQILGCCHIIWRIHVRILVLARERLHRRWLVFSFGLSRRFPECLCKRIVICFYFGHLQTDKRCQIFKQVSTCELHTSLLWYAVTL